MTRTKLSLILFVLSLSSHQILFGQVGIGTTNPHASAIIDITSSEKGFLPPRMTIIQRNGIPNPEEGLVVYCKNCCVEGAISFYNSSKWVNITNCETSDIDDDGIPNHIDIDDDNDGIVDGMESGILSDPGFETPQNPNFTSNEYENFNAQYLKNPRTWEYLNHGAGNPFGGLFKNGNSYSGSSPNLLTAQEGVYYTIFHSAGTYRGEALFNNLSISIVNGGRYFFGFSAYQHQLPTVLINEGSIVIFGIKTGMSLPNFGLTSFTPAILNGYPAVFTELGRSSLINNTTEWKTFDIEFTATEAYDRLLIVIDGNNAMIGVDNFICTRDTDGDGLFDHQDIDSDADGCSDAQEIGHGVYQFIHQEVGQNGLIDSLETTIDSDMYSTPPSNLSEAYDGNCP
ncbi:MAG: hypothetical protein N4A45_09380 [Flavobacteriales bacterium]|jgi:hypothetical protein|nr:hypothetical protein [Flavobacteriales bacterium]